MHTISIGVCACGKRGTLVNQRCGFCEDVASNGHLACAKVSAPTTVPRALEMLVAELAEDVPQPLAQRFTLASVAADLCRLAGEPVPAAVLATLDEPTHAPISREAYQEPA
jgi:hypothetical protein